MIFKQWTYNLTIGYWTSILANHIILATYNNGRLSRIAILVIQNLPSIINLLL